MRELLNKMKVLLGLADEEEYDEYRSAEDTEQGQTVNETVNEETRSAFEEDESLPDAVGFSGSRTHRYSNLRMSTSSSSEGIQTVSSGYGRSFGSSYSSSGNNSRQGMNRNMDKTETNEESSKVTKMNNNQLEVVLSKPTNYSDCEKLCNHLKGQLTLILNLESVNDTTERRKIFDFISGCCCALECNLQKVSELIYVVAPRNVTLFMETAADEATDDTYNKRSSFNNPFRD